MSASDEGPGLRIGELARRGGVPPATLRAWERRYGILEPKRTEAGYRIYGADDERRLLEMVDLITRGIAPAEAADRVKRKSGSAAATPEAVAGTPPKELITQLLQMVEEFDEAGAQSLIDRAVSGYSLPALITEIVLPLLHETGERWRDGTMTVAHEHFASNLVRGRLLAIARGWGGGIGPLALLVCPPADEHDIGLACFGLMLRERGWRVAFLGAKTPIETVKETVQQIEPAVAVMALTAPDAARAIADAGPLELGCPLVIAGSEATPEIAERLQVELLSPGMDEAAASLEAFAGTVSPASNGNGSRSAA